MSTPESAPQTSDLEATARDKQDDLTKRVGTRLEAPSTEGKAPWWKRLLGRT